MTTDTLTRDEAEIRRHCDQLVTTCAQMAVEQGASIPLLLDRLLTFAAAQAVMINGTAATAHAFRVMADNVESGIFDHLAPKRRTVSH